MSAAATARTRTGLLGLGSNVGTAAAGVDGRRARLQAAVDAIAGAGIAVLAASSTYDTDPVGEVLDQPSFLNACLLVETDLEPLALLDLVKELEARLGREPGGVRHGPRAIDIDVLLLGDLELRHERLTLPHPQLLGRRFVLIPAVELDPELQVGGPGSKVRLADALAALDVAEGVRWAGPPLACPAPRP